MANPAQIQSVTRTYEGPQGPNPFLALLQGAAEGYFGRQKEKKQLPIDLFKTVAPSLAATGKIRPTQPGEPGIIPGITSGNWTYASQQIPGYEDIGGISDWDAAKVYEQTMALKNLGEGKINKLQAQDMAWKYVLNSPITMAKPPQEQAAIHQMIVENLMKGQEGEAQEIHVRVKGSSKTGWIPPEEWDPDIYERI